MNTPYSGTTVPAYKTKDEIYQLLIKVGAIAIQWTDTTESIQGRSCPILQFAIERTLHGVEQKFIVRLQGPLLEVEKGRGYQKYKEPNINASMRLLFWYVKSKAEAIEYGLEDVVEAFLPRIMLRLTDGSSSTMGDILKNNTRVLAQVFQLEEIDNRRVD
jgi:hypothetical protein